MRPIRARRRAPRAPAPREARKTTLTAGRLLVAGAVAAVLAAALLAPTVARSFQVRRLSRGLVAPELEARWLARADLLDLGDERIAAELPKLTADAALDFLRRYSYKDFHPQLVIVDGPVVSHLDGQESSFARIRGTVRECLTEGRLVDDEGIDTTSAPIFREPNSEKDGEGRTIVAFAERLARARPTSAVAVVTQRGATEVWFIAPLDERGEALELLRQGLAGPR